MHPSNASIAALLGLQPPPEGLLAWHLLICRGLPTSCLKSLAGHVGIRPKELAGAIGVAPGTRKSISVESSNALYRIAVLWCGLSRVFPNSPGLATAWLREQRPQLRGRTLLALSSTPIGYEYALAAVTREVAAQPQPR